MSRRLALAVLTLLTLGGCEATVTRRTPEALPSEVTSGPATFAAEPVPRLEGRFYAVIGGETSNDNRLYELEFIPAKLKLLTEARRVSSVGACRDWVVVAAGQPEVGYSDHIQGLAGDVLVPIEGFGLQPGSSPALDPMCRLAYTSVDRGTEILVDELRAWDPGGTARVLYRGEPGESLTTPDWGPAGEVAVVRLDPKHGYAGQGQAGGTPGRPAAVIIVRADRSSSEISLPGDPGVLAWGKRWLAMMNEPEGTIFIDPNSAARPVLKGWYPLAWSPDGDKLLVKDAATRRILGVVDVADLSSVTEVGRASGPVHDVEWLSR